MSGSKAPESKRKLRRWLGIALLLVGIFFLFFYGGRPMEPHSFEVDVTDKIAEMTRSASAEAGLPAESKGQTP
ncbi:MAG TPA: hypothetical protein VFG34_08880 [Sphingopyxis sp.]|nr:hypothetical protein [Sphingopyxis sp.]